MRLRHAAALASLVLAGCASLGQSQTWLVKVPPVRADGAADTDAPLSKWQTLQSAGDQADCQKMVTVSHSVAPARPKTEAQQMASAQCIASDDPRLKGN